MGGAPSARRRKPAPDATPAGAPEELAKKEGDVSGDPRPGGEKLEGDVQQQVGQNPEDETQTDAAVDAGNVAEQDEEEMTFTATAFPSLMMRRLDGEDPILDFIPGRPEEHPAATDAASAGPAAAPAANTEETRRLDTSATKTHYWCCLSSSSAATA